MSARRARLGSLDRAAGITLCLNSYGLYTFRLTCMVAICGGTAHIAVPPSASGLFAARCPRPRELSRGTAAVLAGQMAAVLVVAAGELDVVEDDPDVGGKQFDQGR
jgi:hypothetical protein